MKVKCQACGDKIERDDAYKVLKGKRNMYYCNKSEYELIAREETYKTLTMDLLKDISGINKFAPNSIIRINALNKKIVDKYKSNEVMYNTIKSSMKDINEGIENNCIIVGADKINYALAVIDNHVKDGVKLTMNNKKIENVKFEDYEHSIQDIKYVKRKGKNDIGELLKMMGED